VFVKNGFIVGTVDDVNAAKFVFNNGLMVFNNGTSNLGYIGTIDNKTTL
jgi:hypothetical protein